MIFIFQLKVVLALRIYLKTLIAFIFCLGHCADSNTHQPPRGLQFILGTEKEPDQFDTIVMANFVRFLYLLFFS